MPVQDLVFVVGTHINDPEWKYLHKSIIKYMSSNGCEWPDTDLKHPLLTRPVYFQEVVANLSWRPSRLPPPSPHRPYTEVHVVTFTDVALSIQDDLRSIILREATPKRSL